MRKVVFTASLAVAALVPAGSASAHFCGVADKPASAGAVDFSKIKETKSGQFVVPGAFIQTEPDKSIFIRGGAERDGSFGRATDQAIANGPADHGVIQVYSE